jgi:hypothetical protein
MAITLPYEFHTDSTARLMFKGALALTGIMGLGVIKALLYQDFLSLLSCMLCAAIIMGFGLKIYKNVGGSSGSITQSEVIIGPTVIAGVSSGSPEGRYALNQFRKLRIELLTGTANPGGRPTGPHERIYLAGNDAVPDILIARTRRREGVELVREFSEALGGLPVEETHPPY